MRDHVLRHAVGEVLVLGIRAEIHERQHRHRAAGRQTHRAGQGCRERARRLEPVSRSARHGLVHGRRNRGRHISAELPQRRRRVHETLINERRKRRPLEWQLARQHFVQHARERIHVAARIKTRLAHSLLGTHVRGRAHHQARLRQRLFGHVARDVRDAEIHQHRLAFVQQDVLRLDIAMHESLAVRMIERSRDLARDLQRFVHGQPLSCVQHLAQRLSAHVRHHVIEEIPCLPGIVERQDVRVIEPGHDLDFAKKPIGCDCRCHGRHEHFHGHGPSVPHVGRQIHRGHAAAADLALNHVAATKRLVQPRNRVARSGSRRFLLRP